MRIRKTSQTTTTAAQVVNTHSDSQVDAYSCDYVNKLKTYSSTERRIGTLTDGKPLYEKTITGTLPTLNNSWQTIYTLNTDEQIVNFDGMCAGGKFPRYSDEAYHVDVNIAGRYINVMGAGYGSQAYTLIIEYTKTTD